MHTYRVSVKMIGIQEIQADNPQEAFDLLFPNLVIVPTKEGVAPNVVIELLDGKRKSKQFYVCMEKSDTTQLIENIQKILIHSDLMKQDSVPMLLKYFRSKGLKDVKKLYDKAHYTGYGLCIILTEVQKNNYILIIPNNVTGNDSFELYKKPYFKHKRLETLTVVGGGGLMCITDFFANICVKTLDLRPMFKSPKLWWAFRTFSRSNIENLIGLESLNFANVAYMSEMFSYSIISKVKIQNMIFPNLVDIMRMFAFCQIDEVDLRGSMAIKEDISVHNCFEGAHIGKLIISKDAKRLDKSVNELRQSTSFIPCSIGELEVV